MSTWVSGRNWPLKYAIRVVMVMPCLLARARMRGSVQSVHAPHVVPEHPSRAGGVDVPELFLDHLLRERPGPVPVRVVGAPHDVVGRDLGHGLDAVEVLLEGRVDLALEVGARR